MGLLDFVKWVGKKLGIGDEEAPETDALKKELDSYDPGTDKVEVAVEGEVANQSIFEKTIIAVGNTLGVSKVEGEELKVSDSAGPSGRSWQPLERPITLEHC